MTETDLLPGYVAKKLDDFRLEHTGLTIGDHFGAQSPALAEAWVEHLTGTPYRANSATAAEWWKSGALANRGFERIPHNEPGKPGDLAVWSGDTTGAAPFTGTLGILLDDLPPTVSPVNVFTQAPASPAPRKLYRGGLLGFWRPTAVVLPRHTDEQIDAGLKRLDADLLAYLAAADGEEAKKYADDEPTGPTMTDAEVDEAMRDLPDLKTFAEPGDVVVVGKGALLGFTRPAPLPTFKVGDDVTVPRDLVGDLMNSLPHLAPAVKFPHVEFGPTDAEILARHKTPFGFSPGGIEPEHWMKKTFIERADWLAERDAPSNWRPPSDSPMAKWLAEEESKMIGRHVALEVSTADSDACQRDLEAFAAELRGPRIDRRTRLAWAGECLREAGVQIGEALRLLFTLWRRYE
ncbi:peptidase [Arthrobacter phage Abba]|uniref:Peptidase n=1 Tax=Arthrobacter phage Abba TaxID=2713256 RepID=A0A6G8R2G3_9CAUD|nr:peptidase [Arthrobacter phage Abba]QIN94390.1 peptidase [Arthrobacter phage Abba]